MVVSNVSVPRLRLEIPWLKLMVSHQTFSCLVDEKDPSDPFYLALQGAISAIEEEMNRVYPDTYRLWAHGSEMG